jgi:hypothetical protein
LAEKLDLRRDPESLSLGLQCQALRPIPRNPQDGTKTFISQERKRLEEQIDPLAPNQRSYDEQYLLISGNTELFAHRVSRDIDAKPRRIDRAWNYNDPVSGHFTLREPLCHGRRDRDHPAGQPFVEHARIVATLDGTVHAPRRDGGKPDKLGGQTAQPESACGVQVHDVDPLATKTDREAHYARQIKVVAHPYALASDAAPACLLGRATSRRAKQSHIVTARRQSPQKKKHLYLAASKPSLAIDVGGA